MEMRGTGDLFVKDCTCPRSAATASEVRIEQSQRDGQLIFTLCFIPGPSCDTCGKAWRRVPGFSPEISVGYTPA